MQQWLQTQGFLILIISEYIFSFDLRVNLVFILISNSLKNPPFTLHQENALLLPGGASSQRVR